MTHHRAMGETEANIVDLEEVAADRAAAAGDTRAARTLLEGVVARSPSRIDCWLKLSAMCRATNDIAAALAALSGALRIDPLNFVALLGRARLLELSGNSSEAAKAYVRALAQRPVADVATPAIRSALEHAEAVEAAHKNHISSVWDRAIEEGLPINPDERRRLDRFASNILHRTDVYHSQPTHYHYPGLIEREFHDRSLFPWLAMLEQRTEVIRDEYLALVDNALALAEPYIQYAADVPVRQWRTLNGSLDWTAFHLIQNGTNIVANSDRCPQTMATLAEIPQPMVAGRSPNAMFSLLRPRTHIPPHTGIANTRLVCHLPLVVPDGCWFRVGAERRSWVVGEALVFDDTIEHEAANESGFPRVVLIVDLWHPGLSVVECAAIARMMEAEESEHGAPL